MFKLCIGLLCIALGPTDPPRSDVAEWHWCLGYGQIMVTAPAALPDWNRLLVRHEEIAAVVG
jgi:hypothetical protein